MKRRLSKSPFCVIMNKETINRMVYCEWSENKCSAGMLVGEANKFQSHIMMYHGEYKMSCKSLMSMLAFPVGPEADVVIECEGEDEEEALKHITEFIKNLKQ